MRQATNEKGSTVETTTGKAHYHGKGNNIDHDHADGDKPHDHPIGLDGTRITYRRIACQCEHADHTAPKHSRALDSEHPYGDETATFNLEPVVTVFGTFHACQPCRYAGHMGDTPTTDHTDPYTDCAADGCNPITHQIAMGRGAACERFVSVGDLIRGIPRDECRTCGRPMREHGDNLDPRPRGVTTEPQALTAADRAGVVRAAILAQHGPAALDGEITQHSILCSSMHIPSAERPPAATCRECALERRCTQQMARIRELFAASLYDDPDTDGCIAASGERCGCVDCAGEELASRRHDERYPS